MTGVSPGSFINKMLAIFAHHPAIASSSHRQNLTLPPAALRSTTSTWGRNALSNYYFPPAFHHA